MEQKVSVISGANGFIGKHLVARLTKLGHKVVPVPRNYLQRLDLLTNFMEENRPDYIFHLAAYGNHYKQTSAREIVQANIMGTFNMLETSKDIPHKAFVNFGSSSEYGKKERPIQERDLPETDT